MRVRFRDVHAVKKRLADGTVRTYFYHRRTRQRLPDDQTSPEFAAALKMAEESATVTPGRSLDAVISQFLASAEFKRLKPQSQKLYRIMLDKIRLEEIRHAPIDAIKRRHILKLRDSMSDRPGTANAFVAVMGALFRFAVEREYIEISPIRNIKRLAGGEYQPWPDEAIEAFLKKAQPEMALALKVGLYTGQRLGDCLAMRWSDYDGNGIAVRQEKTGAQLFIPVHAELKAALDKARREAKSLHILTTPAGRPWEKSTFRAAFTRAMREAGLTGLHFHGLRKTAATKLAEVGCSEHEIGSITGHASVRMIEHYTKKANQKRRALAAIHKLENAR